ncbi:MULTISPECIES: aspartate aminotransferase family protein [Asticcacaulis]|uniref:aspartate aminotransferase family protein n=1 Tax=Asticcacaulis TaxID=76890 RepID=UPI001AE70A09|nr:MULTISPECIES: aspartate aminotransferase family protein [Asticcacaulis]MBP2161845.1 beta-alanine--pyruvate transaminase [Asticcacaulis solisilvae]MDR6802913.1 beta-alanine--pyruvate transaminase [Asticcacaulis sp. BE141]
MDVPRVDTPSGEALDSFWMPFTPNRAFKAKPKLLAAAKDMHYTSHDGRQILDGTAGLWCVNAGHGREKITEAIRAQASVMDFAPTFNMAHPLAFEFAHKLSGLMPYDLKRIFFTNSGSEAADTALKIALAYQRARGQGTRTRLIGRERAYHGTGFGGISVGGIVRNRMTFGSMLTGVDHLPHTHGVPGNLFAKGQPEHGADLADALERIVALHDASTIAAVIVEPVAGSTGVLIPPKGYLQRLRAICDKHDILLVFDEVITGFGRLGAAFGADYFGVRPDMICMAKGITNATVPMGAVACSTRIYDTFLQTSETPIELFHGYTYSGHPLACAAGIATLDTYAEDGLFQRAADLAPHWQEAVHSLHDAKHVIDIRNLGLIGGIELEPRAGAATARALEVFDRCYDKGVLIRVTGDIIALSPPLIIEKPQIDRIVETIREALAETA